MNRDSKLRLPASEYLCGELVSPAEGVAKGSQIILFKSIVLKNHSVQGGNTQQNRTPMSLDGLQNGINLRFGHEHALIAPVQDEHHKIGECHDVKKRVDTDECIPSPLAHVAIQHVFCHFIQIADHTHVIEGDAFWKSRCSPRVEDKRDIIPGIHLHLWRFGWIGQNLLEFENVCPLVVGATGDLVEEETDETLPNGDQIYQIGHDHPFQGRGRNDFPDVTIVGVKTDNGFSAAVVGHVLHFVGGVYGRDRNGLGPDNLNTEKGDHPLGTIGRVNDHPFPLFHSQLTNAGGEPFNGFFELGIGIFFSEIDKGRVLGVLITHLVKPFKKVFFPHPSRFCLFCHGKTLP